MSGEAQNRDGLKGADPHQRRGRQSRPPNTHWNAGAGAEVRRFHLSIYTISTNSSGFFGITAPKADKVLKRLADETGGRAFFLFKAEDLSESFQDISAELRSQYFLAYRSSNPARDGSFRSIKIETDRKNTRVKARKGYYAAKG